MIYIVVPEVARPIGGININIQFGEILARNGHEVALLYETPDFVYGFVEYSLKTAYYPEGPALNASSFKTKLKKALKRQKPEKPQRRAGANKLITPNADDVIILPEWAYHSQRKRFAGIPQVLMSQNVFAQVRCSEAIWPDKLNEEKDLIGVIATSEVCAEAIRDMNELPCEPIPLALEANRFHFQPTKKKKITYMPRKRGQDSAAMVKLLTNHDALKDYEFVAIDGMTSQQVDQLLSESLIFLSFSVREGFGLPPAEAMAHGCIVIGYTGVGGNEFFTPDVGYPIPEDDIVAFYRTVIEVVTAYDSDPAPFDVLRERASDTVLSRYTLDATEAALLKFWKDLEL